METYHQGKIINDVHKVLLLLAAPRTLQVLPYMTRDCLQILLLTFKQIKANYLTYIPREIIRKP